MYVKVVTLAATVTPVVTPAPIVNPPQPWQQLTFFNPSTHTIYVGDYTASATTAVPLAANGSWTITAPLGYTEDLKDWYAFGTAADKLLVIVIP